MHFDYAPPEWLEWLDRPTAGLPTAVPIVGFNVLIDKLLLAIDGRLSMAFVQVHLNLISNMSPCRDYWATRTGQTGGLATNRLVGV